MGKGSVWIERLWKLYAVRAPRQVAGLGALQQCGCGAATQRDGEEWGSHGPVLALAKAKGEVAVSGVAPGCVHRPPGRGQQLVT